MQPNAQFRITDIGSHKMQSLRRRGYVFSEVANGARLRALLTPGGAEVKR